MSRQTKSPVPAYCPPGGMFVYSLGECANSLVMNSIFAFAMLYYTKALKLDPTWAGIAMSISIFWEAITEPVMGHISDNTRCRWGRRHPYMIVGGLLMAVCSYLIWATPEVFRGSQLAIFWYLVAINLCLRTGLTLFNIPYMALGFEICSDYQGRSRIQSLRWIFNMAANLAGPALAWSLFFQNQDGVRGTTVAANYLKMGEVFSVATALFVLFVVIGTFHRREDTRHSLRANNPGWFQQFIFDMRQLLQDSNFRWIIVFSLVMCLGTVCVSSLQMFVYDDFMNFSGEEKTFAHSSTMVGMAFGSLISVGLTKRFDKKPTVVLGGMVGLAANLMLALFFLTGLVPPGTSWMADGTTVPLALGLFVIFQAAYWLGIGIAFPVATAMVADVSEIHFLRTGVKKDGGYASIFSLTTRLAYALGLTVSGYCLHLIGYRVTPGAEAVSHNPAAVWRLGLVTFGAGAIMSALGMLAIRKYPVTWEVLEALRGTKGISPTRN
ncbi:MAG TPA: MFS transporter [Verrucomicrobiae bacterium]|nr:MFS transporter [Verrucomicrobiae bacterium]